MAQDAQSPPPGEPPDGTGTPPGGPPGGSPPGGVLPPGPGGGYPQLPPQPAVPATPPTNGMAIAGFVCALCGIVTCGVASVVGLILSIVAMNQIKQAEGRMGGKGLAIAGLAISIVLLAFWLLYLIFAILVVGTAASFAP